MYCPLLVAKIASELLHIHILPTVFGALGFSLQEISIYLVLYALQICLSVNSPHDILYGRHMLYDTQQTLGFHYEQIKHILHKAVCLADNLFPNYVILNRIL